MHLLTELYIVETQIFVEQWMGTKEVCSRSVSEGSLEGHEQYKDQIKHSPLVAPAQEGPARVPRPSLERDKHSHQEPSNELSQGTDPGEDKAISSDLKVWTVLTPFRTYNRVADFIAILIHHQNWHRKVIKILNYSFFESVPEYLSFKNLAHQSE
jgi:hypothetical protein